DRFMDRADRILADLTPPQRQAVTHVDGPLLIIAGAGSGKTRVITRRVAWLIRQGIAPSGICAITFTNKAAAEMRQRVEELLRRRLRDFGQLDHPGPSICTFHSLCLRILRHYASLLNLSPDFTIYDSSDQARLLKDAIKLLDLSTTNFPPAGVQATISRAKNQLVSPEAFAAAANGFYERQIAKIYARYQSMLQQNRAMDFDDLLMRTAFAMRDHPRLLAELQQRFSHIMIDEYQDTNHAQYIFAHALAGAHRNLAVVGDPDQSIYAWRGADIRNILDFERDYPDATVVRLEQNYRSTPTILALASELISHNTRRKDKALWTENPDGGPARVFLCQDENDEARVIVEQLQALHKAGRRWSDMAVFYRMNALSRVLEKAMFESGVPYQIARGVEFYNRKEIKDVLAYLRVIANPADQVSLERILNVPARGLSDATVNKLKSFAVANGITLFEALRRAGEVPGLSNRAVQSAGALVALLESCKSGPVQAIMERVIRDSGYEQMLKRLDPAEENEIPNIEQLITSAAEFDSQNPQGSLVDYLAAISLISDADHIQGGAGAVTLMTLHAAKGLEFPVVAIIGLEEGCLPHSRARESLEQLEEERRLLFVGITRAQQDLILTKAAYRTLRGLRERTISSPFLAELPAERLTVVDRTGLPRVGADAEEETCGSGVEFREGQLVRHPRFGLGRIAQIAPGGRQTRAVVEFNTAGRKTLILEYAGLQAAG
ncbi:MAG: UvrD-helicase domain-containing protein, partial [Phycisphaerae bacterium]|nr:UvrD-helicase domain-containing protein [Phycisphaerae bacterium]